MPNEAWTEESRGFSISKQGRAGREKMENSSHEQVLDAATRLFAEKGHAAVSLGEIADAAGVNVSAVSELFTSVDKLYEAVLETQFNLYAARMDAVFAGAGLPPEKMSLFAEAMCDLHKRTPCFFPLFYRELIHPSPLFEPIVQKIIRHVAYLSDNTIARGIRKGEFKQGINPAYATMCLAGMLHYYFLASRLAGSLLPEPAKDEEYLTQSLKVFLTGLLNPLRHHELTKGETKR
jgi:TetR/AcrR family transcriptional regulator